MENFGNFSVENELMNDNFDLYAINDDDDELFRTLDTSLFDFFASTVINNPDANIQKMNEQLKQEEDGHQTSRFKYVSEADMRKLEESHQSTRTRTNTKWAVKIFQGTRLNKLPKFTF